MENKQEPRGIRNNNPLNIRYCQRNEWLGRKGETDKKDKSFEEFKSMYFGIRAGFILISNYIRSGHRTVELIITRWAPLTENKTEDYIRHVCEWSGFDRQQVIDPDNPNDMISLVYAMIRVECGKWGWEWKMYVAAAYVTWRTNAKPLHEGRYEMVIDAIETVLGGPC